MFSDNAVKQYCSVIPILLMLQYTSPANQCLVKMEQGVILPSGDTIANARMIIMEPTVTVSIIVCDVY